MPATKTIVEQKRLEEHYAGTKDWLKWGPYLSERQWGTVREDYSAKGNPWNYFPHDHARSRAYRWGEDGIAGICDDMCNLCFAVALWNGKDAILKERLFGLTGPEGNHAEDVKELYYYLDSTPTHSYMKHLYKYPQAAFPYEELTGINQYRSKTEPEYEILDTGVFDQGRYFDVFTEYAKASETDILIKITVYNRSVDAHPITVLPTLWFRNKWSFGLEDKKPDITLQPGSGDHGTALAVHKKIGPYYLHFETAEHTLFTENETNTERLYNTPNAHPFVKDLFHQVVIDNDYDITQHKQQGTKFAPVYRRDIEGGGKTEIRLRLTRKPITGQPFGSSFDTVFGKRQKEADAFYAQYAEKLNDADERNIQRQAFAGMMWTKQYYNIDVEQWLNGDPGLPAPPPERLSKRNIHWRTLNNEDIISMPDKWEYPWYAAWDLAFHCVPIAMIDPDFAKNQLILFLREWYMHPNGQIPAYEWSFGDVNPPVHCWACMRVYEIDKKQKGKGDIDFLKRTFQKLLLNFTWWVNRKDHNGNNVFEGGFLGLDNISVFDRSKDIPAGGYLEQADGTSWMAMYCLNMLEMAIEIALEDPAYEDVTTKFFEHFVYIAEAMNRQSEDWTGAWDEESGFFYDILALPNGTYIPLKVRSLVGLSTLFAVLVIDKDKLSRLKDFKTRMEWFRHYRMRNNKFLVIDEFKEGNDILLSLIPKDRLERLLVALLDEREFFSPVGIRSLSKYHEIPYSINISGREFGLKYEPGESSTYLFGGNSNWRGPVWMPTNYLIIHALREFHKHYAQGVSVPCPSHSPRQVQLDQVADDIVKRLIGIFKKQPDTKKRPVHGHYSIFAEDPNFSDLITFYEYFHGEHGRGLGASHQTGWTGLIAKMLDEEKQ
jgi:hypothetical protein